MLPLALALVAHAQTAAQPAPETRLLRQPAIHGDSIVFVHAGDLWVTSLKGGPTRRLTSGPGIESRPHISPDGKTVAFTGQYDGNPDIYTIPLAGGEPTRLTYEPQTDITLGWTPDGRVAYSSNFGSNSTRSLRLWTVAPTGGMPRRTTVDEIGEGSFLDADTIVYNRFFSSTFNWRRYRGGTQGKVSIYNLKTQAYRELPTGREQNYWPMAVGDTVIFASDKKLATLNLYQVDLKTGKETTLTSFSDADVRYPTTDGKRVAFERDGLLYTLDLATKVVTPVRPIIEAENLQARPTLRNVRPYISSLSLSPSGARALIEARGEIFSVPTDEGDTRNLTESQGPRERYPIWSPDGKSIAYTREDDYEPRLIVRAAETGEETVVSATLPKDPRGMTWMPDSKTILIASRAGDLAMADVAAKSVRTIFRGIGRGTGYDISPDGKWIALTAERPNGLDALYLYEVATGKLNPVTDGYYNDVNVEFDRSGKYLYLVSERTFNQPGNSEGGIDLTVSDASRVYVLPLTADLGNPLTAPAGDEPTGDAPAPRPQKEDGETRIDFDGLAQRAVPLPFPAGNYAIKGMKNGVIVYGDNGIQRFDLPSREVQNLAPIVPGALFFNADVTKMGIYNGATLRVVDVRPNLSPVGGNVDLSDVTAVVDPRAEWKEIFWESWRWYRDNFYDANMRGVDWKAVGDRYAKYLPYVDHRSDLNEVIGRMIAELGTGHSYVNGGDPGVGVPAIPTGLLGADYAVEKGKVKFAKVFRGDAADESRTGPLAEVGDAVKPGDFLLAIDGKPVDEDHSPSSRLVNKVGRYVTLTVSRTGTLGDARKVRVMPMGDESSLRYADWVNGNRRKVAELSGGRIAYIHVPDTSEKGASEFARGFRSQTDKEALIVDERDNAGGNLPTFFVDRLAQPVATRIQQRNGIDAPGGVTTVPGPRVMIINQNAGSGGDMFPYLFRKAGLGPLIGLRTWGGLVGISDPAPLVDGGSLTVPEFSIYDPETNTIVAENRGVDPDIEVDNRPDLVAQGRDPQLEKAVEVLLGKLKAMPPAPPRKGIPAVGEPGRVKPR